VETANLEALTVDAAQDEPRISKRQKETANNKK